MGMNKEDIRYLLQTVDKLAEMRRRYRGDRRLYCETSIARKCVYYCALGIPLKEGKADD